MIPAAANAHQDDTDVVTQLAALRQSGADRWSPVQFYYMETLVRRMDHQPPRVQRLLQARLDVALSAYPRQPAQDPNGVKSETDNEAPATPLAELVRALAHNGPAQEASAGDSSGRIELKSVRNFRNTWSALSAQKHVTQALGQGPKNAGPINSHMLVLRSLALMRSTSPDYLNRFMSYADTLLCLDQCELRSKPVTSRAAASAKPAAQAKPRIRAPARR